MKQSRFKEILLVVALCGAFFAYRHRAQNAIERAPLHKCGCSALTPEGQRLWSWGAHTQAQLDRFNRICQIEPNNADAFHHRAQILHFLKRDKEAVADCDRAIELEHGFSEAYDNRASYDVSIGIPAELERDLEYARVALDYSDSSAHHDTRGLVLLKLGRAAEARAEFDLALRDVSDADKPKVLQHREQAEKASSSTGPATPAP